jgi:hypothetical protein
MVFATLSPSNAIIPVVSIMNAKVIVLLVVAVGAVYVQFTKSPPLYGYYSSRL